MLHLTEQKGKPQGKAEEVRYLITKLGLSKAQAADIAKVSIEFVRQVTDQISLYFYIGLIVFL